MSIEKHPTHPGWYRVKSYPNGRNGKPQRDVVTNYADALQLDKELKAGKTSGPQATHPRLVDVVDEYLEWARINLAPTTYATRERRLQNFVIPVLGKYRVKDLRQTYLDSYRKTVAYWTFDTDLTGLMGLIKWMVSRNYAEPLTWKPEKPRGEHRVKAVPHPADLMRAIESMPNEKHRIMFSMSLFTGLRWNEVANLRWEDVDLKRGCVILREVKRAKQDLINIPTPLLQWFQDHKKATGIVFEGRKKGKPYGKLWKVLEKASKICGITITSHTFRHASATYLYEQTHDIYQVQAHLRHRQISTSQIYARMSVARRQSAVTSIIDYVANNTKP